MTPVLHSLILRRMAQTFFSIDDARLVAKRRLPRLMFDFIDGAAGQERAKLRNREAIERIHLKPRVLVNVDQRNLEKTFLGKRWGLPFGIAPMGMCNLAWPGADLMLAKTAVSHNIPLTLSTMSSTTLETVYQKAGENAWFQLYVSQSDELAMELVDRASVAGYRVLMLTVDVPQVAPRLRDLRNGFKVPFRIGPKQFIDFATHPRWSLTTLFKGAPSLRNIETSQHGQSFDRHASRGKVDWNFLERLRQRWPHTLIIKGVMSPEDVQGIQAAGADGVYVSNHGGRQLDSAPPAIKMLPLIRQAVGKDFPILFDSGIRSGEGVVKALALGADFVMLGRPFLYGIGAAQQDGLNQVVELLKNELSVTLAQLGCPNVEDLDESVIG
ncbi:MAG: alpha-hydroxy acid oxidase [Chloroflexota bacterium]